MADQPRGLVPYVPPGALGLPSLRARPTAPSQPRSLMPATRPPLPAIRRNLAPPVPVRPPVMRPLPSVRRRSHAVPTRRRALDAAPLASPRPGRHPADEAGYHPADEVLPAPREGRPERAVARRRPGGSVPAPAAPPGAYEEDKATCPLCGHLARVTELEEGPYTMGLYVQQIGGPVRPGRVRVTASGNVVDHSHNTRGSIVTFGVWDAAMADALEDIVAEAAERIAALARDRALAAQGHSW